MTEEIRRILIAEDEEDLLEMYTRALTSSGFMVLPASNGKEALNVLEKEFENIDIILLDIVMPEMDGFEALKMIKSDERFRKITVLVSTNLDNDEDRKEAFENGAREYFVKSQHTPSELVVKVKELLESDNTSASPIEK
ncbi:MAG: response regulator [bacterium]